MRTKGADGMGVDDYRDREGDAEERTGVGQGERVDEVQQDAATDVSGYHDSEGDAEERTGLGSDPEGVDSPFGQATDDPDPSGG
jgi:hypothetical protein